MTDIASVGAAVSAPFVCLSVCLSACPSPRASKPTQCRTADRFCRAATTGFAALHGRNAMKRMLTNGHPFPRLCPAFGQRIGCRARAGSACPRPPSWSAPQRTAGC